MNGNMRKVGEQNVHILYIILLINLQCYEKFKVFDALRGNELEEWTFLIRAITEVAFF